MKLQARNFVVRKPETIDITMFFKKFCIATRTIEKALKLKLFQGFFLFILLRFFAEISNTFSNAMRQSVSVLSLQAADN